MRKKQMLALFMSLSLLAQGMLFGGCGQKSIGEQPAQTRTETEEAQSVETTDSKNQDQTTADKTQDQDVAQDEANGFALRFTEALLKQKKITKGSSQAFRNSIICLAVCSLSVTIF